MVWFVSNVTIDVTFVATNDVKKRGSSNRRETRASIPQPTTQRFVVIPYVELRTKHKFCQKTNFLHFWQRFVVDTNYHTSHHKASSFAITH